MAQVTDPEVSYDPRWNRELCISAARDHGASESSQPIVGGDLVTPITEGRARILYESRTDRGHVGQYETVFVRRDRWYAYSNLPVSWRVEP